MASAALTRRRKPATAAVVPGEAGMVARSAVPNFEPDFFASMGLKIRDDPFERPYQQHPWVYACITAMATAGAQVPYRLVTEKRERRPFDANIEALRKELPRVHEDDREMIARTKDVRARWRAVRSHAPWLRMAAMLRAVGDVDVITEGPWYEAFRDVNPMMTRSQLWEATLVNYNGEGGECFWILEGKSNAVEAGEVPKEIWPMAPKGWKAIVNKRTRLIDKWEHTTTVGGVQRKQEYLPHQVVHFRRYNPYHAIEGTSPYDSLKRELEADHLASVFNAAYFKNGAQIGGYAFFDRRMTPDQRKDFMQMLEARHRGANKAWRPAVFEGGVKFEESKANHRMMQFKELREWVREAVMIAYRVPKSMLGLGTQETRATALAETRNFWETNLLPQLQYMEDLCASDLFTAQRTEGKGIFGVFDVSTVAALREDLGEKTDVAAKMCTMGFPLNDVNERLELGMEPVAWGDTWWKNANLLDVTLPPPPPPGTNDSQPDDDPDGADDPDKPPPAGNDSTGKKKGSDNGSARYWAALVARLFAPGEASFDSKLRSFLFALRNHQLSLIDTFGGQPSPDTVATLLFELDTWQAELRKRLGPVYAKVFADAYAQVQEELALLPSKAVKKKPTANDPEAQALVDMLTKRVGRTVKTFRGLLLEEMYRAVKANGSKDDVKRAVKGAFQRYATRGKVQRIARTEASSTVNQARKLAHQRRGIEKFEWITAADERVRETHVQYGEGGAQRAGFNWAVLSGYGGDDSGTYTLEFPCDPRAPAGEVINCRCILIAVPSDEG